MVTEWEMGSVKAWAWATGYPWVQASAPLVWALVSGTAIQSAVA